MSVSLGRYVERSGMLPTTEFVYRKGLGTCDVLCRVWGTYNRELQVVLVLMNYKLTM